MVPKGAFSKHTHVIPSQKSLQTGAGFVAVALAFFAEKVGEDHNNWFTTLMQHKAYDDTMKSSKNRLQIWTLVCIKYEPQIRALAAWFVWIGIMIVYSIYGYGWSYVQAQYFAISTLSTGGLWGLKPDAPQWMFGLTGFMAALGVPVMAVALAQLAMLRIDRGDLEVTKQTIMEEVTGEELLMLRKLGLENSDGVIKNAEYIILCTVRMGQDPHLIELIVNEFNRLDGDRAGCLTVEEVTGGKYHVEHGQIVSRAHTII